MRACLAATFAAGSHPLRALIGACTHDDPRQRPAMAEVRDRLAALSTGASLAHHNLGVVALDDERTAPTEEEPGARLVA